MAIEDKKIIDLVEKTSLTIGEGDQTYFVITLNNQDFKVKASTINPYIGQGLSVNGIYNKVEITTYDTPRKIKIHNVDTGAIHYKINGTDYSVADNSEVEIADDTKNYTVYLDADETLKMIESETILKCDAYDFLPVAFVPATGGSLGSDVWSVVGDLILQQNSAADVRFSNRFFSNGVDVASANNLSAQSNYIQLTDNTEELRLFNINFNGNDLKATIINVYCLAGQVIKHNYPTGAGANDVPFFLKHDKDLIVLEDKIIQFYAIQSGGKTIALKQITEPEIITGRALYWYNTINEQVSDYLFENPANTDTKLALRIDGIGSRQCKLTNLNFYYLDPLSQQITAPEIHVEKLSGVTFTDLSTDNTTISLNDNDLLVDVDNSLNIFSNGDSISIYVNTGTGTSSGSGIHGYLDFKAEVY